MLSGPQDDLFSGIVVVVQINIPPHGNAPWRFGRVLREAARRFGNDLQATGQRVKCPPVSFESFDRNIGGKPLGQAVCSRGCRSAQAEYD
jgi:hypothetical protein